MYSIDIEKRDGYIYAIVNGEENLENSIGYWQDIAKVCNEHDIKNVLVEDYLEGDIPMIDVHHFSKYFTKETGMPIGAKIASVSRPEKMPVQEYAEMVAMNWSGVNVRVFSDMDRAKAWLLNL